MDKKTHDDFKYAIIKKEDFYDRKNKRLYPDISDLDILVRNNDDVSCKINNPVLIFLGSFNDNFGAIYNIIKFYPGPFIYLIDRQNKWYINKLKSYYNFINLLPENYINTENYIFMGFSMGGYAALYLSVLYPDKRCICITITPQVMNFFNFSNKIYLKDLQFGTKEEPPYVTSVMDIHVNIQQHLLDHKTNTKIFILIGKSECSDFIKMPDMHMYLDLFHAGSLSNFDNVAISIFNRSTHILAIELDLPFMFNYALNNFDELFYDYKKGIEKLSFMSYRKNVENKNINEISIIYNNIDDYKSHIRPQLQNLILYYGNNTDFGTEAEYIANLALSLKPGIIQSLILCPLIWSALYINGYNIPLDFLRNKEITADIEDNFSHYCIKLSQLQGWCNYAIYCLIYNKDDNLPSYTDDVIIPKLSLKYTLISQYFNFNIFLRDTTKNKYLKYKEKYLKLMQKNKLKPN